MNRLSGFKSRVPESAGIFSILFIFTILINVLQFSWHSEANNPTNISSHIYGALTGELLLVTIGFIATAVFIYIPIGIFSKKLAIKSSAFISFTATTAILVSSWHTYKTVGDFSGLYTIQMLYHDSNQIFDRASRMPSMKEIEGIYILSSMYILAIFLSFYKYPLKQHTHTFASCISILSIIFFCWHSSAFNSMKISTTGDREIDAKIDRIEKTNYEIAVSHAGPYTKIIKDIAQKARQRTNTHPMLTDKLKKIHNNEHTILSKEKKLNIVYIIVESLRDNVIDPEKSDTSAMPFSSELARKSLNFKNVWAQSSHSNYADIASITGQYPLRSELIHFYPENPKYPLSKPWDHLSPYGYKSAIISSQNEHWGGMSNYLASEHLDVFDHVGSSVKKSQKTEASAVLELTEAGGYMLHFGDFMYRGNGNSTQRFDEVTAERAMAWIDGLDKEEPFSLHMNFQASHYPYNYFPESFQRKHLVEESEEADNVRNGKIVGSALETTTLAYYDSLAYVDKNISDIFKHIEGINPNNTIYVITADTSTSIHKNYIGNGGTLFPEVLKIPLIIYDPRTPEQQLITVPTAQIDILPTLYGLTGIPPDPAVQGIDILKGVPDFDRAIFSVAQTPAAHEYAVIEGDWELIFDYQRESKSALYVGPLDNIGAADMPEAKMKSMSLKLQHWINTQLEYYKFEEYYKEFYPPPTEYYDSAVLLDG